MNNAGLPGTGLFYILLALWMPVAELYATLRGRSSRERWRLVWTQFALACGILAAVGLTLVVYLRLADVPTGLGLSGPALAYAPALVAVVMLGLLVVTLRIWARVLAGAPAPDPHQDRPSQSRPREAATSLRG